MTTARSMTAHVLGPGTGKTFTMEGDRVGVGRGIIPRAIDEVFAHIENDAAPRSKYLVRAAFLQIYNEVCPSQPLLTSHAPETAPPLTGAAAPDRL